MSFGKRLDGVGGRRAARRERVTLPAAIITLDLSRTVDVVNVSATGARLRGSELPPRGKTLMFRAGPVDTLATVVWVANGLCGIRFDDHLTEKQVDYLRREGRAVPFPGMSYEERLAAEDWVSGSVR